MQVILSNMIKTLTLSKPSENEETIIHLNSQRINYLKIGNGPEKIVLLPGSFGTIWKDFKPQIEGLNKNLVTILVLDPPGQGYSRPPERVITTKMFEHNADILYELIKVLSFEPISLLGWCNGGISGIIFAAKYPESINKLIIWGSNSYISTKQLTIYEEIRDIRNWSQKELLPQLKIFGEELLQNLQNKWCDVMIEIYKNGGDICCSSLKKIKCPTLILHGCKDIFVGIEHTEYLVENIKKSKLYIFPEGKHQLHLQFSEEFNSIITKFLLD